MGVKAPAVQMPGPAEGRRGARDHALAAVWGFAEATLFFVVPDVLLTWFALDRPPRRAYAACAWAVAGALAGGALMHAWGAADPAAAARLLERVPAVSADDLAEVEEELASGGLPALFLGPLTAKPYKLYAAEAGAAGVSLAALLAISVPARGVRFVLLTALARGVVTRTPAARLALARRRAVHLLAWAAFYLPFWALKGW